jgi:hypothetical protein
MPETEPDYEDVKKALDLVSVSAKHNNEMIRKVRRARGRARFPPPPLFF